MLHIKRIIPRYTQVITTADHYEEDDYNGSTFVMKGHFKGDLKQYQTVVAVGQMVREVEPGMKVMLSFKAYQKRKISPNSVKDEMDLDNPVIRENLPYFEMDNENGEPTTFLMMDEKDILYPFEGEEEEVTPNPAIIVLNKKLII